MKVSQSLIALSAVAAVVSAAPLVARQAPAITDGKSFPVEMQKGHV